MDSSAALQACEHVLEGLDVDLIQYIATTVLDEKSGKVLPREDLVEMVAPMLEELCDGDESKADTLATSLWETLSAEHGTAQETGFRKLENAVRMGGEKEEDATEEACESQYGLKSFKKEQRDAKQAAKEQEKREARIRQKQQEMAALTLELDNARKVAAAELIKKGQSGKLGTLEIGPFTLPNPGGGADLLEDASMVLVPGHRYGLIGRNGKGKSTLLKWLASRRVASLDKALQVYYVHQEVSLSDEAEENSPADVVLAADFELKLLLEERETLETQLLDKDVQGDVQGRLGEVESRLEAIGASTARIRASKLLKNLGFSDALLARKMRQLSGGWRVRTALAAALFSRPDVLLLDEPTNHLSIDAVLWLSKELATGTTWKSRIVVVVSHDRYFIDDSCTDVVHISGVAKRLTQSRGSYSTWAARRSDQQKAFAKHAELQAQKREKLLAYTQHGFKYGGSTSQINMQQKKLKEIKKMDADKEQAEFEWAALKEDEELPLTLEAGGLLEKSAVQLKDVGFTYPNSPPDHLLLRQIEFSVDSSSRICLLGENGTGKTTLVKLICEALEPTTGIIERCPGARIKVVNQHHADQIPYDLTPLAFMLKTFPGNGSLAHEQSLRAHLANCGCGADLQGILAGALSGGQRSRVALAAVSYARPHVLILDEPTNNLDLEAVESLVDCVQRFEGGVVLVSHDQYFVSQVGKTFLALTGTPESGSTVKVIPSFEAYKKAILARLQD